MAVRIMILYITVIYQLINMLAYDAQPPTLTVWYRLARTLEIFYILLLMTFKYQYRGKKRYLKWVFYVQTMPSEVYCEYWCHLLETYTLSSILNHSLVMQIRWNLLVHKNLKTTDLLWRFRQLKLTQDLLWSSTIFAFQSTLKIFSKNGVLTISPNILKLLLLIFFPLNFLSLVPPLF